MLNGIFRTLLASARMRYSVASIVPGSGTCLPRVGLTTATGPNALVESKMKPGRPSTQPPLLSVAPVEARKVRVPECHNLGVHPFRANGNLYTRSKICF